jgi:hypothetical protein
VEEEEVVLEDQVQQLKVHQQEQQDLEDQEQLTQFQDHQ